MKNNYYFVKPYDKDLALPPKESFGQILKETYLQPFTWAARTTRKSYWLSMLTNLILSIIVSLLFTWGFNSNNVGVLWGSGVIAIILSVWIFLSHLGQTVRRLHDVNYSGYWDWLALFSLFIFYLTLQPSKQKPVKWGNYLFLAENDDHKDAYYAQNYDPAKDTDDTPIPTNPQIMKEHFFECFKWNARSTRTSYWTAYFVNCVASAIFALFYYMGVFTLSIANIFTALKPGMSEWVTPFISIFVIFVVIYFIFAIWLFIAQLGHTVRRLHDAGFSGWWWWLGLIPVIGIILLNFMLFHPTYKGEVKWNGYLFNEKEQIK